MSKPVSPGGDAKKPAENHAPTTAPASSGKGSKGSDKLGCHAVSCKEKDVRFNFCEEHFKQFKFGLITKTGERVVDHERKLEHYQNWVRAQSGSRGKVA